MPKTLKLSTILLSALLLVSGCGSVDRDLGQNSSISSGDDIDDSSGQGVGPSDPINDLLPPNDNSGATSDGNSTVGQIKIDAKNAYKVKLTFSDNYREKGYFSTGEVGKIHFDITNLYNGRVADTSVIESIKLISPENGKYFNFIEFSGKEGPVYTIAQNDIKASDDVALKINNLSGTTNLIFEATIKDMPKPYVISVPVVIEKNKSSSMAIVPYADSYDKGLFIKKFVIHIADSYGNKAKDDTAISTGVINNPKLFSYDKGTFDRNNATFAISSDSDVKRQFPYGVTQETFSLNDVTNLDTLIILANQSQYKPYNLGGWDIASVDRESNQLKLVSVDSGDKVDGVSYVVGDEYRYDYCNDTVMNGAASSFETTEVKDGIAYAELRYVPAMVGKTVYIYANAKVNGKHIGISRPVVLTGTGLKPVTVSCKNDKGESPTCSRVITMIENDSNEFARAAWIARPYNTGDAESADMNYSRVTDCNGNLHVIIKNIDENKTASYTFGVVTREPLK